MSNCLPVVWKVMHVSHTNEENDNNFYFHYVKKQNTGASTGVDGQKLLPFFDKLK